MSDYIPIKGFIYLIKMCDTNHRIIYKVGKSINFYKRYKGYNYAEILTFIISDDITNDEDEIINIFSKNCKLDKGREFFTAQDDIFVLHIFVNYFNDKIKKQYEENIIAQKILSEKLLTEKLLADKILDKKILEEKIVVKKDNNNNIIYNPNCDKTCPTCKIVFKFPSRLKTHLETTIHCKKSPEEIKNYFINIKKQKARCFITNPTSTNTFFKCDKCDNIYTFLQNLNRHKINSKCTSNDNDNINDNINILKNKFLNKIENL